MDAYVIAYTSTNQLTVDHPSTNLSLCCLLLYSLHSITQLFSHLGTDTPNPQDRGFSMQDALTTQI